MNESRVVIAGAALGALIGAAGCYLFFTPAGRGIRDRFEPSVDELRREFARFRKTVEKVGEMANDGLRMVNEFNAARIQSSFSRHPTSH